MTLRFKTLVKPHRHAVVHVCAAYMVRGGYDLRLRVPHRNSDVAGLEHRQVVKVVPEADDTPVPINLPQILDRLSL